MGSDAVKSSNVTLPPGPTLNSVDAKPSTRDTFTSAFRCRVNSGRTCRSHSTLPTLVPLICSTCALPFQIEPDTPEAAIPAEPRRDSTMLAGNVTNARMTNAPTPSAINGHKRFIDDFELLLADARQHQVGVHEPGFGGAVDGGGLDIHGVDLLEGPQAHHDLVELGAFQAHTNAVLAVGRLTGERRAQAALARGAIDEHDQGFVARSRAARRGSAQHGD